MLAADLELLKESVRAAARIAMSFHRKAPAHKQKPDGTIVTEADLAVDAYLKSTITTARPDDGWLSEETPDTTERLGKRRLWIVDPIDGTRDFQAGGVDWAIGAALAFEGRPVVSVLYRPADDVFFHAVEDGGAFCNGKPLLIDSAAARRHVITHNKYKSGIEAAGFSTERTSKLPLLLRFSAIAEGKLAGAISSGPKNDWDIAAGHLILKEAGGILTTEKGGPVIYNRPEPWQPGVVAAQAQWHRAIMRAMETA